MKERLKQALLLRYPEMKDYIAERCVSKYVDTVMPELLSQFVCARSDDIKEGEINFSEDSVCVQAGQVKLNNSRPYIYTMMNEHPSTRLIIVNYKGNNKSGRVSRVTINQNYRKEIMEAFADLSIELKPEYLDELEAQSNASWDINIESLASYIKATKIAIPYSPSEEYEAKLIKNLRIANEIVNRCKEQDGKIWIDEYWEQIDSGRIHGHGISLQRIPKEVRHAALGHCHRYDLKAASYALMTSYALKLDPTLKVGALKDFIKNRSQIRTRIASEVGISESWMKDIFISMGFGAEVKDNPYNHIRSKIGQDNYNKLVSNSEFAMIKSSLDKVSNTINKHFPNDTFELCGRTYTQLNPKDGKKRTKNQKLAWIYQCLESHAMSLMIALIPESLKTMLLVHDCVYLDKRLPSSLVQDMKWKLQQAYELLNFEHEEIFPIHAAGDRSSRDQEIDAQLAAHRALIQEQSHLAKDYVPIFSSMSGGVAPKRYVDTPWGPVEAEVWEKIQTESAIR